MSALFQEIQVGKTTIKNRVVVPPMVCFKYSDEIGFVSEGHLAHYEALAKGGAGLIVVEATCVLPDGRLSMDQMGLWQDEQVEGMKAIVEVCHKHGAKVVVQLHHAGEKRAKTIDEAEIFNVNTISLETIETIRSAFVNAAKRAVAAGFDGVEIHGAHGYLLCQMANPEVNQRSDAFGGSLDNRLSLAKAIISDIQTACPELAIIGYRTGANEPDLEDGIAIAKALESYGVNLLHVSAGLGKEQSHHVPEGFKGNWIAYMGTAVKKAVSIPVILVNGVRLPEEAAWYVEEGLIDFVALGRAHLVDPEWANKAKASLTPVSCLNCKPCRWFKDGRECPRVKERA